MLRRIISMGIAAATALTLSSPALAHGGGGMAGGGGGFHGGGGAVHSGDGSMGRASVTTGESSFGASNASTAPSRGSAPTTARGNVSQIRPSVALGGHSLANTSRTFDGSAARVPDSVCRAWDRGHEHLWNNHRCRFFNGAWYAYDGEYPNDYADYGSENPSASDVIDNPEAASAPAPVESAPVVSSSPFATVQDVQEALAKDGYYHGEIDGNISPQMRSAVAAFQRDHRLSANGSIDSATLSALGMK